MAFQKKKRDEEKLLKVAQEKASKKGPMGKILINIIICKYGRYQHGCFK